MKLPISLLVLAALGHAAAPQSAKTKGSEAKSLGAKSFGAKNSDSKQKDTNQTSKRELFEGNFGDRKDELLTKYVTSEAAPRIEYAENLKEAPPEQSPAHQTFGARLPEIAKISDVLTGQGPSFEAAVANHLYAPVSVYQARLSSPTLFEVPAPAASQLAYPNPKAYQHQKGTEDDQKQQEPPSKEAELPRLNLNNVPATALKQPKPRFESYPLPLRPAFPGQASTIPHDIFRQPQPFSRQIVSPLLPVYNQFGHIRYQGNVVPLQYLQQFIPDPSVDYVNLEGYHVGKGSPNQESREELKAEPTQRPQLQNQIPLPKQGYHAHPNGAISFASFTQSLPSNTQHETATQTQTEKSHNQQQLQELSLQQLPLAAQLQPQKQKFVAMKPKLPYPPTFDKYLLQKYQQATLPEYQHPQKPQYFTVKQHLVINDPRQVYHPPSIQFQELPAFKPLSISQYTSEFFQPTSASLTAQQSLPHFKPFPQPRPFGYHDLSTQQPSHTDQPLAPTSQKSNLTPLPPLKHNYNQYVKPLNPSTHTSPVFLPSPVHALSTSTPTAEPAPDQLVSSTTLQPDVKDQETKAQSINTETQPQPQTYSPLEPEIIHQSQPTVLPLSIQSTTKQPFAAYNAQSEHIQHSTPQPEYQSTIHPQSIQTSPRHEVVIQQQEVQELILDPSPQISSTPHYQSQLQHTRHHQQELEALQLQHRQLLQQLKPLQYQQELNSQQYNHEARQLQSLQQEHATQTIEPQQYQNQQHSQPLQQQFQPQQLQTPQQTLSDEQHRSEQQVTEQIGQQRYQEQQHSQPLQHQFQPQQLQTPQQTLSHEPPRSEQQQQVTEQIEQQQYQEQEHSQPLQQQFQPQQLQSPQQTLSDEPHRSEQQQQVTEQIEQQQYQEQQHILDPQNQIQISTPNPSQERKKEAEQLELQHQPESQPQTQYQLLFKSPAGARHEQSDKLPSSPESDDSGENFLNLLLSRIHPVQIYGQPRELVAQTEFGVPLSGTAYPDVQYFGKYAESIFSGHQH